MKPTLYEKVVNRLQNHRLVAGLILVGTVVIALSAFTDATKNISGLFINKKPNAEEARIKLASLGVEYTPVEFIERAGAGDSTVVNLFLAAGMDPNTILHDRGGPTALFLAARENHLPIVDTLLKAGAKVINEESNSLVGGAESGNAAILNVLLKTPVERSQIDEAFTVAKNRRMLEILLAHGADVKKAGPLALLYARDPEAVKFLFARGADLNTRNSSGRTLLEEMDYDTVNLDTLRILIDRGADLSTRDKKGWTLLNTYAFKGYREGVEMLLAKGVKVDAPNPDGRTALSLACELKYSRGTEVVRLLVKGGAEVNMKDRAGRTPLYYARQQAGSETVQLLEENGAKEVAPP